MRFPTIVSSLASRFSRRGGVASLVLAASLAVTLGAWWWLSERIENLQRQRFAREAAACVRGVQRALEHTTAVLQNAQALMESRPADDALLPLLFERLRDFSNNQALAGLGTVEVRMYGQAIMTAKVVFMEYAPGVTGLEGGPSLPNLRGGREAMERTLTTLQAASVTAPSAVRGVAGPAHLVFLSAHEGPNGTPMSNPNANLEHSGTHNHRIVAAIIQDEPLWQDVRRHLDTEEINIRLDPAGPGGFTPSTPFRQAVSFKTMDLEWKALIEPGPKFSDVERSNAPLILLAGGSLLSALLFGVVLLQERARASADLRDANRQLTRFKAVAEATTDMVALARMDGSVMYINGAGRAMLGIGPDDNLGGLSKVPELGQVRVPDVYPRWVLELFEREGFPHALEHGHWSAEVSLLHSDGHEIPVSFVGLILKTPEGEPEYTACVAREISAQRQLQEQLRQSLDHERELNTLKGNFVNTISHEFRTPLGIILFATGMMRRFDSRLGPEERERQLTAIENAVSRMNDLVEQSLSLGRAEAAEPRLGPFDPLALCRRIVDEVQSATAYRCRIWLHADGEHHRGRTDETMLHAILTNLLCNAVKYSGSGSQVILQLSRSDGTGIFTIRDHGQGLSEEDIPRLFTDFHRGRGTQGIPGTGLGLAIVKRCTEALGGAVKARNADDGGAEFVVQVPIFIEEPEVN